MELMELYNQIQNPMDDPKVIEKLVDIYANSKVYMDMAFYSKLVHTVKKERSKGRYNRADSDRFYSTMFNKWKNSIVALTSEQFNELYRKGIYGQDFINLRKFLMSVPDVKTKEEADNIFSGKYGDKELKGAIDKYKWTAFGEYSGWIHVCSEYLTAHQDEYPNIEHRLYLDTESLDTYEMLNYLVEKCDEYNLPYYFKFDQYGDRDDTIVIYSSTENLTKYVEILQEIKKEHPDLIAKAKDLPILTGKIDGFIGYGSEPGRTPDGEKQSFNEIRANVIEPAIGKTVRKWIMNNRDVKVNYQGQELMVYDYLAMKATEKMMKQLELQGIKSSSFKDNVYKIIRDRMDLCISSTYNGTYKDMPEIKMQSRDGKKISFTGSDLEAIIRDFSTSILKNDSNFVKEVRLEIIKDAKKYGIDTEKFCFDIKRKEKMRIIDEQRKAKKQSEEKISKQQLEKVEVSKKEESIDLANLDIQTLPRIINPALMERKMRLPNGSEISAQQYIQEIVYPQLPEDGVVILNTGGVCTVQQFIEECVMFECQEKYNGDFSKYMAEKTRNNLGVITIRTSEGFKQINPVEITDYLSPVLMERNVKLPNGSEISAKQYVEEVYAPHIPANGRVRLNNGSEISAKQYIEEVLLFEGQLEYNGDLGQILYNTTRSNNGYINTNPKDVQESLLKLKNQTNSRISQTKGNIESKEVKK